MRYLTIFKICSWHIAECRLITTKNRLEIKDKYPWYKFVILTVKILFETRNIRFRFLDHLNCFQASFCRSLLLLLLYQLWCCQHRWTRLHLCFPVKEQTLWYWYSYKDFVWRMNCLSLSWKVCFCFWLSCFSLQCFSKYDLLSMHRST